MLLATLMECKTILLEKILDEVIDHRLKEQAGGILNHLNGMRMTWDKLLSVFICMFDAQRLLNRVLNHFTERWWSSKIFLCSIWGMNETFSNCEKLSSALVPRTENDCSPTKLKGSFIT